MPEGAVNNKPRTITFRLDEQTLEFLRRQALEQKTSLNTLVNQIFAKYLEWDSFAQKYGFLNFPNDFYKGIVESANEELLRQNASLAGKRLRDYLLFTFKRADTDAFLNSLKLAGRYGGLGSFAFEQQQSLCKVVVHHNLGKKHSLYVGAALEEAVTTIVGSRPKSEVTEASVILEFETRPADLPLKNTESDGKVVQNLA